MYLLSPQRHRRWPVIGQPKWKSHSIHEHPLIRSNSSFPSPSLGIRDLLRERINLALQDMYNLNYQHQNIDIRLFDGTVFPTPKPEKFGDYQCNVCMPLAKHLKVKPRDIATHLVTHLQVNDLVAETSVAGPGFLNFR